ncbi:hypothetical protein [Nonomuraea fuscirosea]|uniref:hypothetical protein n=1 Tax=Nonomuraea fuscirosea TaxID=1291556 RepID=UPI0034475FE0
MIIPYRHQVSGAGELPAGHQLLLQTVTDAAGPLICKHICQAAGLGTASGQVDGTRAKLNRPAERGLAAQDAGREFRPATRPRPATLTSPRHPDLGLTSWPAGPGTILHTAGLRP